ncbi:MAG: L,D-transpeptidase family protein, partial [Gammaproteobacteria bacterium]
SMASVYMLPEHGRLVGVTSSVLVDFNDTLLDIGKNYGFGLQELKLANPGVDTWLPGEGRAIVLPSEYILPNAPMTGIVLNIPEMRLYYYPEHKPGEPPQVITYPLGIGREGWSTPYMKTRIIQKKERPTWIPPESIRKEHEEMGDPLPKEVPPGPDNPMGEYALKLAGENYSIHGTNKAFGMGMRVSHGCIRLYNHDIEDLFHRVKVNTPVNIINQPYKVGEKNGVIYLEVHPHLDEDREHFSKNDITEVVKYIIEVTDELRYKIDWDMVRKVVDESIGMPVAIGMNIPEAPATTDIMDLQTLSPAAMDTTVKSPAAKLKNPDQESEAVR